MRIKRCAFGLLPVLLAANVGFKAFSQLPLPDLIEAIKPSIVAVSAHDDTVLEVTSGDTLRFVSFGSGVLVRVQNRVYVLTNEHVIAIKDSLERTIRYARSVEISLNVKGIGALSFPARIERVKENLDLAALKVRCPKELVSRLEAKTVYESMWKDPTDIKEGETVIYSGYPLRLGRGERNYPLSREGIVSQLVPGSSTFLIDAFVQPGYSGSPVFLFRIEPEGWKFYFIGIAKGYPGYIADVYREVGLRPIPKIKVRENPGFSVVVGVPAIRALFGLDE
jgi:S1-C subfamily serine protease